MRASVDLPEPDSPTMPTRVARLDVEADTGERVALGARSEHAGARQAVDAVDVVAPRAAAVVHVAWPLDGRARSSGGRAVLRAAASSSTVYGCCGALDDARRRARLDDRAAAHHEHVVGDDRHEGDVVGDEQQRRVLARRSARRAARARSACTVTSSAVVGSSAMSSAGRQARAMAMPMRWRCPPDSWCGYARTRARPARAGRRGRTARWRRRRPRPRPCPWWRRSGSAICLPTRISGLSAVSGFWNTIAICSPRSAESSRSRRPTSSCAVEHDAAGDRGRCRASGRSPPARSASCPSPTRR